MAGRSSGGVHGPVVLLVLVLWFAYGFVMFNLGPYPPLREAVHGPLIEESFGLPGPEVEARILRMHDATRALYTRFQWMDMANAVLTALAFAAVLAWALTRVGAPPGLASFIVALPIATGVLDLAENGLLLGVLGGASGAAGYVGVATSAKLVTGLLSMFAVVGALLALGITMLGRNRRGRTAR